MKPTIILITFKVEDFNQFINIGVLDLLTGYLFFWNTLNQHEFDKLDIHSSFWAIVSHIRNEKSADMAELPDQNPTHIRPYKLSTSYLQYIWLWISKEILTLPSTQILRSFWSWQSIDKAFLDYLVEYRINTDCRYVGSLPRWIDFISDNWLRFATCAKCIETCITTSLYTIAKAK